MKQRENLIKVVAAALLIVIGLLSFFVFAKPATDAARYADTIEAIDEKKATVMAFTATAAGASTAIAAIPGDASTPIANQIMEISEYLFLVVCFLVMEKSLLTVMGYLAFKVLIPVGCAFLVVYVLSRKQSMMVLGAKLLVFAFVIWQIIPFSVTISDMIYDVNRATVEQLTAEVEMAETTAPVEETTGEEEEQSFFDRLTESWNAVVEDVETVVSSTGEKAEEVLNKFIDAIALFIIAYCAIPVVVVFVVIWLVKFLFQVQIPVPVKLHKRHEREAEQAAV